MSTLYFSFCLESIRLVTMSQQVIGVIGEGAVVLELIEQGLELGHVVKAVSESSKILNSNPKLLVCENKLGSAYLRDTLQECTAVILSLAAKRKLNPDAIGGLEKLFNEATVPWYVILDRFEDAHLFLHSDPKYVQQQQHFAFAESLHNSAAKSTVIVVPTLLKDDPCFSHSVVHEAQVREDDHLCIPNLAYFLIKDIEATAINIENTTPAELKKIRAQENPEDRSRWFGLKQPT